MTKVQFLLDVGQFSLILHLNSSNIFLLKKFILVLMDCICFEISFAYNFNSAHLKYVQRNENFKKLAFISLFTIFIDRQKL